MRSTREILRLAFVVGISGNEIHRRTNVSRGAIQKCIIAAKQKNITWQIANELDDTTLEEKLFSSKVVLQPKFAEPDWSWIYTELKRSGVNKQLLWKEYAANAGEDCFSYSQFNRRLKSWLKRQELSMRQEHKAGDKLFVDYAGDTVPIVVDRENGEVKFAQIFVAVLGASNYTYVDASWSQDLPSWIGSHVRALEFMKGVPQCLTPDNLRSAVTKADAFDPYINKTYQRLAEHYQCSIRPARKYRAKDKAKAEKGVQLAQTWILARLRNYTFFSVGHLNETIRELLIELNNEPFQKLPGTRHSQYLEIELPALRPLPPTPFEIEEWLTDYKIEKDYHVTVDGHYYSVPHHLRSERVDVRYTDQIVEVFHKNTRVTSHPRNPIRGGVTTRDEHRPPKHALYAGMSAEKFLNLAQAVGTFTHQAISAVLQAHPYPQLAFDKCFGILYSLRGKYGDERLEAAAEYSIRAASPTYRVIKAALETKNLPQQMTIAMIDSHTNIRGQEEYK